MPRTGLSISGSVADRLTGIAGQLKHCENLRQVEYQWPRLVKALEDVATRVGNIRSRGGRPPDLDGPLDWLDQVVEEHPAFAEPNGESCRAELLTLIYRIRHTRRGRA